MIYAILAQLRSSIKKPKRIVQNIYKVKPQTVKQYDLVTVWRPSRTESKVQTLIENSKAPRGSFHFIQSKIRKEAEKRRARAHSKAPRGSFHFVPSKIRKEAEKPGPGPGGGFFPFDCPKFDFVFLDQLHYQDKKLGSTNTTKSPTYCYRTRIRYGFFFDMDPNVSSAHSRRKKKIFLIQFYFDFEYCLFQLFLWVSNLFVVTYQIGRAHV